MFTIIHLFPHLVSNCFVSSIFFVSYVVFILHTVIIGFKPYCQLSPTPQVVPKQQNIPAMPAKAFLHLTLRLNPVPSTLQPGLAKVPTVPCLDKASLTVEQYQGTWARYRSMVTILSTQPGEITGVSLVRLLYTGTLDLYHW